MTGPTLLPEKCVGQKFAYAYIVASSVPESKVLCMAQRRQHLSRRPDGRYLCRYKGICFYGDTEREALKAREEYKNTARHLSREPMTVARYAAKWLPLHKHGVSKKTYNDYAKQIDALNAAIGTIQISKVTVDDAMSVYAHYEGYSESTIKRARMLYISLFDAAIENDLCQKNPFRSKQAQPDKGTVGSHRALTAEEDRLILETPAGFRLPVLVMRYAGLRRGEMLALDVDRDVDFKKGVIHVHEAVRYDSNQPIVSDPKTAAGNREVPLLDILRRELKDVHGLIARSAGGAMMSESAFKSAWDKYINTMETKLNGCHKRWYGHRRSDKALLATGEELPPWIEFDVRPHDLRHSYCTMLRDAGVDMNLAIAWMGHADEKMILKVYDHVQDRRIADNTVRLENFISPKRKRVKKRVKKA